LWDVNAGIFFNFKVAPTFIIIFNFKKAKSFLKH